MTVTDYSDLLLHVGYPKAGSTSLQRRLFTSAESGFCSPWGQQAPILIEHVRVTDTFIFDETVDELRASYDQKLIEARQRNLAPVLSFEHLLVDPMGGQVDRREGVRRMSTLFPGAKVLLIIREQKSIILSAYLEHLRRGFTTKLDRFLGIDERRTPGFGCTCPLDLFLYDRLISHMFDHFGKENVLVLPLEQLGSSAFLERIYDLVGQPFQEGAVKRMQSKQRQARKSDYVFLRFTNRFGISRYMTRDRDSLLRKAGYGVNLALNPLTPASLYERNRRQMKQTIENHVGDYFKDSNRRTSDLIGTDLGALGYPVDHQSGG
ncbi:hypothetical protein GCM10016455_29630 [Aliiroseovarius zhejiangensis]|uniref:Sulfotransferase domain-containing protein n=1 Tax=Aliiroseovarius zhejiangensis TaxID=1632025 RepID=A0ABQ3JBL2_9RHOB|nr:hypothetical protein [Aliiroseovarius zhejiangensis]GHF06529.1 hypothetical protein GCM10016455_29630 [Aliiroseovarius zhejiangensis]